MNHLCCYECKYFNHFELSHWIYIFFLFPSYLPIPLDFKKTKQNKQKQSSHTLATVINFMSPFSLCLEKAEHIVPACTHLHYLLNLHPPISLSWFTMRWTTANTSVPQWILARPCWAFSDRTWVEVKLSIARYKQCMFLFAPLNSWQTPEENMPQIATNLWTKVLWSRPKVNPQPETEPH